MATKCRVCGDASETGQRYCGELACPMKDEKEGEPFMLAMPRTHEYVMRVRQYEGMDYTDFVRIEKKRPIQTSFLDVTTGKVVHEIVPPSASNGRFHFWKANGRWFLETPHGVIGGQEVQHLIDWIDKVKSIFEVRLAGET